MSLTEEEFEEQLADLLINYLENCSPKQIYQALLGWNFDNPKQAIAWIASSPKTDKGSALLLFWLMEPDFAYQFDTREEMLNKSSWYAENFDIVETLEKNYLSNFYKQQNYAYTPPAYFHDNAMKRAIPKELFIPLTGEEVPEPTDWEDGFPAELQAKKK
ncbi:hypothetical protein M2139_000809 [Enterococcus sp. PF1-24]|uniref:DUF4274 domain-containing protein n=1 Tax=unclassified Enterococcus TaxID=2608891 RepID=UPI002473FCCE|nr:MULTISPECIES: DUF4274 domain-containing protein [unclassified Enterococcus]MDH6363888.1 hypothetical protein [Enterococcus sp. PFB1-1]MDH6400926.1 hypothetical protein [Enterococcus sp. PF1-24]